MGVKRTVEACGRCTMSSVVSIAGDDGAGRNPFDGDRIELSEEQLRAVSRHVMFFGRLKDRLDGWMFERTYRR